MEYYVAFIAIVLVAGIRIFLWWLRKNDDYWRKRGIPYQPRPNFISSVREMNSQPFVKFTVDGYKKHGRIYGEFELRKPYLCVSEPDLLRDILVKDFHKFNYRKDQFIGDPLIDRSVFHLKGEDWKRIRTIITPAFTSKKMRQLSNIINESSKTIMNTFGKHADSREPLDCRKIFGAFTMDVIASSAFATKIDSHNDPDNTFVRHVKMTLGKNPMIEFLCLILLPTWINRKLGLGLLTTLSFFKGVILEVISQRKLGEKKYNDFLQLLMDAQEEMEKENSKTVKKSDDNEDEIDQYGSVTNDGALPRMKYNRLTNDELVAQCILFFVAGYETSTSTLGFLAYSLATNPECQETLIKEIDDAFEKHKEISHDVVRDLKYLDWVLSETLRMYPIAVRGERTATEDYKLGNTGIIIEKGFPMGYNIYAMHHDPELFADPEKFDPERFKPENISHHQYAYLPFGAGPRNCLGMRFAIMEIKLCICNILLHYRLKVGPTTKVPLEYNPTPLLGADIQLIVERRVR